MTFQQLQQQYTQDGFAVVELNGGEFTIRVNGSYTQMLNQTMLTELDLLIQMVQEYGYQIVPLTQIQSSPANCTYKWTTICCLLHAAVALGTTGGASEPLKTSTPFFTTNTIILIAVVGGSVAFILSVISVVLCSRHNKVEPAVDLEVPSE